MRAIAPSADAMREGASGSRPAMRAAMAAAVVERYVAVGADHLAFDDREVLGPQRGCRHRATLGAGRAVCKMRRVVRPAPPLPKLHEPPGRLPGAVARRVTPGQGSGHRPDNRPQHRAKSPPVARASHRTRELYAEYPPPCGQRDRTTEVLLQSRRTEAHGQLVEV